MRYQWGSLFSELEIEVQTLQSRNTFKQAKSTHEVLSAFEDALAVLHYLDRRELEPALKEPVVRALIELARINESRNVFTSILLLSFKLSLERLYRFVRCNPSERAEVAATILEEFLGEVHCVNLDNKLQAALKMNTRKRVIARRRRASADIKHLRNKLPEGQPEPEEKRRCERFADKIGLGPTTEEIRSWLVTVIGDEADLVVAVYLDGQKQLDLSTRLGISHAALRKRVERLRTRLRDHLEENFVTE